MRLVPRSSHVRYAPKATFSHQNAIGRDGPIADIAQIPACLIADVNMRAMTGLELCQHLCSHPHGGQGELKYGAARFIRLCPQSAPMGVDDRPAN
jgi:CheY-like chemotaxis protein